MSLTIHVLTFSRTGGWIGIGVVLAMVVAALIAGLVLWRMRPRKTQAAASKEQRKLLREK
jgi:UPF0716 family protein affecting phage T7 exclusion